MIVVELVEGAERSLVESVVAAMREQGLAVPVGGRAAPFSVAELIDETGLSDAAVRRLVQAGVFEQVKHTSRILVTVDSVRKWQRGEG